MSGPHIYEPLVATLVLLIIFLTYGQVLPAPFVPVPRPPTSAAAGGPAPTQVLAIGTITSPLASVTVVVEPTVAPTPTAAATSTLTAVPSLTPPDTATQPTPTPSPVLQPTATLSPQEGVTPTEEPSLTPTETTMPTAAPETPGWDLARDIIGLWEQTGQDEQYYLDFLEDGIVMVAENGARTYGIEGNRTIVIQMPGDPWVLTVRDLSEDRVILEGVFGPSDEFHRESGVANLREEMIGLWTDPDDEYHPLEFTPGGIALGEFGRGTYRAVSNSHVWIECDDPAACAPYREYAQPEDAPLSMRVYEISGDRIVFQGLGNPERWTFEQFGGYSTLAADIVGLWEDESGATLRFTDTGGLERDDGVTGSYQVLSETTLWIAIDGGENAWVITELGAEIMSYTEFGDFMQELWTYSRIE